MCCGKTILNGVMGLSQVALQVNISDKNIIEHRRNICRVCEFATKNKDRLDRPTKGLTTWSRCTKCHCLLVAKTQLNNSSCPVGKW